MSIHQNNLSRYSILFTGIISLVIIYFFVWRVDAIGYGSVIGGDGNDYYSYLMSVFINKNLGHQDTSPWYVISTPGGTINVHTVGVSLLLLPFFLIGYVWASLSGFEVNGISEPFQKMVSIGAFFYAVIGLTFIRKLLLKLNIRDVFIAVTIPLIFFGTNLLNYSLNEPSMSHAYSFGLISAFLYYSFSVFNSGEKKYFFYSALVFSLIILVRPINGIVIFIIPFWSNSFKEFILKLQEFIMTKTKLILSAFVLFISVLFIQSFVWMAQNGKMIQWSYKDNGLYLLNPSTFKMLFGFNSGFFIYTPLCLLLMLGLVPLFRENTYKFYSMLFFLIFMFYLFSCHWAYTYFDGLSIRPMVDFYSVFAILGAKLISSLKGKVKAITIPALTLCLLLNLLTCYQYKAGILPPANMNFEKYKYIFLKTNKKYAGILGGCDDLPPYSKKQPGVSHSYKNAFDTEKYFDFTGREYGEGYSTPLGFKTTKIYVKVKLDRKEIKPNSSSGALMVFTVESPEKIVKNLQIFKMNDVPSKTCCNWRTWEYNVTMDGKMEARDILYVYVWNKNHQSFLTGNFNVEVYNYNYEE